MDCAVSAGGIPQADDSLYQFAQGRPKALIDIAGKPMVQWVIDALSGSRSIDRIVLVGLGPEDGISSPKLVRFIPDQGSMLGNAIAGADALLELNPAATQAVFASADIPLITAEIVDDFIEQAADAACQFNYGAVERSLMEGRFPESRRSFVHLTEGDFAGADIFVVDPRVAHSNRELWNDLLGSRKHVLKQARRIGFGALLKLLLRRMSMAEAAERVSKVMGFSSRGVMVRHAELGMDVDQPFQLAICRRELEDR